MTTEAMQSACSVEPPASGLLARLTRAEAGPAYLAGAMLFGYCLLSLAVMSLLEAGEYFGELAAFCALSVACIWLGSSITLLDGIFEGQAHRLPLPASACVASVWTVFVAFALLAWATADRIPLLAALGGADPETIAVLRELFLKGREGWQSSFVYINAILSGALIPYSIALMFLRRMPGRWLAFSFFLLFCISFVEKAFFLKAAFPLLYLVAQRRVRTPLSPNVLLWATAGLLLLVTVFSGAGSAEEARSDETFFSAAYVPQGPLGHIVWRSVAIPLVTAADAVRVLHEDFNGRVLWGATSSLLAALTGTERVEYERLVFAAQWGQNETGTGSSNSVFITEAYVNFGWGGVALFSLAVGLLMRLFARSRDDAFRALWMLFALGVYTSGFIGLLFSNGFVLLFAIGLFVRFTGPQDEGDLPSPPQRAPGN